jgi:hypothetical protein
MLTLEFFLLHVHKRTNDRPERGEEKRAFSFSTVHGCAYTARLFFFWGSLASPNPSFICTVNVIDHLLNRERGGVKDLPLTKRKLVLQASIG